VDHAPGATDSRGEASVVWQLGTKASEDQGLTAQAGVGKHHAVTTVAAIAKPVEVSSIAFVARDTTPVKFGLATPMAIQATDPFGNKFVPSGTRFVSLDTSLCVVDSLGSVSARKRGFARVVALAGAAADTAWVHPTQVVHAIVATPDTVRFHSLGQTVSLAVQLVDDQGLSVRDSLPADSVVVDTVIKVQAGSSYSIRSLSNGMTPLILRAGPVAQTVQVFVRQRVASVKLSAGRVSLDALGDTVQMTTTVSDSLGAPLASPVLAYSAGDTSVVTVGLTGLVTSKGNGATWVHTTARNGATDSLRIIVAQQVARVVPERDSLLFDALQAVLPLHATPLDRLGSPVVNAALTYASGAPSVATVDESGNIRAIANGNTEVIASYGSYATSVAVRVAQRPVRIVPPTDTARFVALGETRAIRGTGVDSLGSPITNMAVTVSVADTTVVERVDSVTVRSRANGSTVATLTVGGIAAQMGMVVRQQVANVKLSADRATFDALGDTVQFSATLSDSLGALVASQALSYTAADTSIVTVGRAGLVTSKGNGSTWIHARASNGVADSVRLEVAQQVARVAAKRDSIFLDALQAVLPIQATALDRLGYPVQTAALTYATGLPSIATVDTSGHVRAIANGTTLVTAAHGTQTAVVAVRVAQRPVRVVASSDTLRFVALGETRTLSAVAMDSLGSPVAGGVVSILVADTSVVQTLDSVTLRARKNGMTTAGLRVAGVAGQVALVVSQVPTALTVSPQTVKAVVGDSFRLSAAAFDELSNPVSMGPVTWTVTDAGVATVAGNGIAHPVSVGTTTVSAQLGDLQASATVEVLASRDGLPRILVSSQQLQLLVGDTARLGATVFDSGGTVLPSSVVWSSDDTQVATVGADGLVHAQNVGTVVVATWAEGVSAQVSVRVRPGGGPQSPGMAVYDSVMLALMDRWGIPGGALAVVKDGRLVLARGYGYADTATREMVGPTSLFRLASLSKPITAAAVMSLVDDGRISLDTPLTDVAGDLLSSRWADVDPRIGQITVRDLLDHTAGWDPAVSGEPNFAAAQIASDLGLPAPPSARTIVQAGLGRPLDFAPGDRQVYSNFGYNVLGRIIENVTGGNYQDYVRTRILARAGVTGMQTGLSLPDRRLPGEVGYYSPTLVTSQFPGYGTVYYPYGGFYLEGMDASSGWVGSAVDVLRFLTAVDGFASRPDVLSAAAVGEMTRVQGTQYSTDASHWYSLGWYVNSAGNWYHGGTLPGSNSVLVRLSNGIEYAAVFNADPRLIQGADFFSELLDGSIRRTYLSVTSWPTIDLFDAIR